MIPPETVGTIYLLHFDRPYFHATHYLGWAKPGNLERRLEAHRNGNGANLMAVIRQAGIGFELARTWHGDRYRERRLKTMGGKSRMCPTCMRARRAASGSTRRLPPHLRTIQAAL